MTIAYNKMAKNVSKNKKRYYQIKYISKSNKKTITKNT